MKYEILDTRIITASDFIINGIKEEELTALGGCNDYDNCKGLRCYQIEFDVNVTNNKNENEKFTVVFQTEERANKYGLDYDESNELEEFLDYDESLIKEFKYIVEEYAKKELNFLLEKHNPKTKEDIIKELNLKTAKDILYKLSHKNETVRITYQTNGLNNGTQTFENFMSFYSIFKDIDNLIIDGQVSFFDGINHLAKTNQKLLKIKKIEKYNYEWVTVFDELNISYKLIDYINTFFNGSQISFAEAQGVNPAQVTQWLKKDFIVVDHKLFSHRRDLKLP